MKRQEIIEKLQQQFIAPKENPKHNEEQISIGLGQMEAAFKDKIFPQAAIHEFISLSNEDASCSNAFISVLLGKLNHKKKNCVWVSNKRKIFPPALKSFGIDPEQLLFIDTWKTKDTLWAIEEALKCDALTAVVGELSELSFDDSRRLQLAVEKSRVTGFIHRQQPKTINTVACVSRWKITSAASALSDNMPGVGFPTWQVELLKVRNGKPGKWLIQWSPEGLKYVLEKTSTATIYAQQTA